MSEPVNAYVTAVIIERLSRPDAAGLVTPKRPDLGPLHREAASIRMNLDTLAADMVAGLISRSRCSPRPSAATRGWPRSLLNWPLPPSRGAGTVHRCRVGLRDLGWPGRLTAPRRDRCAVHHHRAPGRARCPQIRPRDDRDSLAAAMRVTLFCTGRGSHKDNPQTLYVYDGEIPVPDSWRVSAPSTVFELVCRRSHPQIPGCRWAAAATPPGRPTR